MKKILLLSSVFLFLSFGLKAQNKVLLEGFSVIYGVNVNTPGMNETIKSMMPKEMVITYKGDMVRTEMVTPMTTSITIIDTKKNKGTTLMEMFGNKIAMDLTDQLKSGQDIKASNVDIEITKETKMIAGYKCTKAITRVKDSAEPIVVYFTEELPMVKNQLTSSFSGINGCLLEFSTNQGGMALKMTAKTVSFGDISDNKFIVPEGYQKMDAKDLQNMFK